MPESSDISASDWSDATESKKPHKCSFSWCKAAYSKAWKLVVHMRKHSGEVICYTVIFKQMLMWWMF